jgi:hypothetical protein
MRDMLTPMTNFEISPGQIRDLAGTVTNGWWVVNRRATPKMIVAQVFDDESGRSLIDAMVKAGATMTTDSDLPRSKQSFS